MFTNITPEVKEPEIVFGAKQAVLPVDMFKPVEFTNIKPSRWAGIENYDGGMTLEYLLSIEGVYLAGGSLRNLLGGDDQVADIDIFFRDISALQQAIKVMDKFKGDWYEAFKCPAGELITFKTAIDKPEEDITDADYKTQSKIQFITKCFYSSPIELINSFDFVPTCACFYEGTLYTHPEWIKSVRKKLLNLHFVSFPVASLYRMMKYRDKGYKIPTKTAIDFVTSVSDGEFDGDRLALYVD